MNTRPHLSRGFRLWETMLCSCSSSSEIAVTFFGPSLRLSRMASLVGFASVEKNPQQVSLRSCFSPDHLI